MRRKNEEVITFEPGERYTFGVVADTHVPDRHTSLHPAVIPTFRDAHVSAIIHAGDIAVQSVLDDLGQVARVIAVRGNRDWLLARTLTLSARILIGGMEIGVAHGHGGLVQYLVDKLAYLAHGYRAARYQSLVQRVFPRASVVVYGHTHRPDCTTKDGCLYFNPGAAGSTPFWDQGPSIGLLEIGPDESIRTRIIPLSKF